MSNNEELDSNFDKNVNPLYLAQKRANELIKSNDTNLPTKNDIDGVANLNIEESDQNNVVVSNIIIEKENTDILIPEKIEDANGDSTLIKKYLSHVPRTPEIIKLDNHRQKYSFPRHFREISDSSGNVYTKRTHTIEHNNCPEKLVCPFS